MSDLNNIALGDYWDDFINAQMRSGKYASANDVIRAALRLLEMQELRKHGILKALIQGEESGFVEGFGREGFFDDLHRKHHPK